MNVVGFKEALVLVLATRVKKPTENVAPEFSSANTERYLPEDASVATPSTDPAVLGALVGRPVTAKDANEDADHSDLSYMLGGTDVGSFAIDHDTGQITVGASAKLDYETSPTLMVEVTARDPHGLTATITVTIRVTDVDEAPVIMATAGGLRITGPRSRSYAENDTGDVADYSVSGANGGTATWSLTGTDRGDFDISEGGVVTFESAPDYESQSSYTFTVKATVNGESAERGVTVSVTNVDEDGTVSVSPPQPVWVLRLRRL